MKLTSILLFLLFIPGCKSESPPAEQTESRSLTSSEQEAVDALEKLGGEVVLDESGEVKSVTFDIIPLTEADLVHLKVLTSLKNLSLIGTQVTDGALVHLKGLTNLQELDLSYSKVTDAGLVHLKGMTNLQRLNLMQTKVTDAGVKELKTALPKCEITWK